MDGTSQWWQTKWTLDRTNCAAILSFFSINTRYTYLPWYDIELYIEDGKCCENFHRNLAEERKIPVRFFLLPLLLWIQNFGTSLLYFLAKKVEIDVLSEETAMPPSFLIGWINCQRGEIWYLQRLIRLSRNIACAVLLIIMSITIYDSLSIILYFCEIWPNPIISNLR